jgi:hypothetical protein
MNKFREPVFIHYNGGLQLQIHVTRHGVLSRCPLQALTLRGVNSRLLRRTERSLRAELKPLGTIGETVFELNSNSFRFLRSRAGTFARAAWLVGHFDAFWPDFRGTWDGQISRQNRNAVGSWTLLNEAGEIIMEGTWSAQKMGQGWQGWTSRALKGGVIWDLEH